MQAETGYQGCDSVTINDCGPDDTTYVVPLKLPPSGNIVLDNTGTLAIDEGGTGTFTVKLDKKPDSTVTVDISSTDTDIASPTAASASLIFTSANYDTAQTVTITGVQDSDNDDEQVNLTIVANGSFSAPVLTKTVSVDDDEDPSAIVLDSSDTLNIDEGDSGTFTVKISPASTPSVVVTLAGSDSDITVSPSTLTFATGATAAQRVTVSAAHDADRSDESATITASTASITAANVVKRIAVKDDDIPSGNLGLDNSGTSAIDEGGTGTFTVKLDTEPSADVTVSISSDDAGAVSVDPASLTFTVANYDTAQTVTVTGVQDADNDSESVTLTIAATGGIAASSMTKTISVIDDEAPSAIVLDSTDTLNIDEGGSGTFTVRISPPSTPSVEVDLAGSDSAITVSPTTLTFAANASAAQRVTVNAAQDADNDDESATITITGKSGITSSVDKRIAVEDDEPPSGNLVLDNTARLSIGEGGGGTFKIRLDVEPSENVTVSLSNPDTGAITVNPASLTFTIADHLTAQTVTVTAPHDIDTDDESVTLTIETSGGLIADDVTKDFTVDDDDEVGSLVMLPSSLQVAEGGQETFLVRLGKVPTVDSVIVSLTNTNPALTLSPATLTFTDGNWNANQSVTVFVEQDDNDDNGTDTITGAFADAVGNYATAAGPRGATISVVTLDRPGDIVTSVQMVDLMEGGEPVEFTLRLGEVPINTDTVTVTLSSTNPVITVSPAVLLFTRDNWGEKRSATLQAGEDGNKEDGYGFITLSGGGGNYSRAMSAITVSVVDNDVGGGVVGDIPGRSGVYALAIPPTTGSDSSDIRIRCKQSKPCAVYFDCTTQEDGGVIEGWLPELIPAWGARTVGASEIVRYTGDFWYGKGRLGCLLRSKESIGAQVWTRSGDGVLVNNSALLESVLDPRHGYRRADIESIPSPDGDEKTNLRIRCLAPESEHCTRTAFSCFADDGTRYEGALGRIDRLTVRHLQTGDLASLIDHRWEGMGLSCELRSDHHFTVQVMTRTGGGGALVNNSATGVSGN